MKKSAAHNVKNGERGYALPTALLLGVLMGIFALTMVMLLIRETKDTVAVQKRAETLTGADAAVDRALAKIKLLGNWDQVPALTDYQDDLTYTDIAGVKYTVEIIEGDWVHDEISGGDQLNNRTVTVRAINNSTGVRRQVQAVISRQPFTSAVSSEGGVQLKGNSVIYWGNLFNFDAGSPMVVNNAQPFGPGYPEAFSISNIDAKNRGSIFSQCDLDNYYHPNQTGIPPCESMPNPPGIDWMDYRERARTSACDWGTLFPLPAWWTNAQEGLLFEVGDDDHLVGGGPDAMWSAQIQPRLDTMVAGTGEGSPGCGITDPDILDQQVLYWDTDDGNPPDLVGQSNFPRPIRQAAAPPVYRGSILVTGDMQIAGGGGTFTNMTAPPGEWLPPSDSTNVNFHGLVVSAGDFGWAGTPLIYGSIVTFGDFTSAGTIVIYFNYEFPYQGISGGTFAVTAWREQKPDF